MTWGGANRPKISNRVENRPINREGADGDIQIKGTGLGAKLFAKWSGRWWDVPLSIDGITKIGTTDSDYLSIDRDSVDIYTNSVKVAEFGQDTTITGGSITLQGTTGTIGDEKLVLENNAISFFAGGVEVIDISGTNATLTVGRVTAGQSNVYITSGALEIRNNVTAAITLASNGTITTSTAFKTSTVTADSVNAVDISAASITTGSLDTNAITFTSPNSNVLVGANNSDASSNTISIGSGAGENINIFGNNNVAIGDDAQNLNQSGLHNVAVGSDALFRVNGNATIGDGDKNVAVGYKAGINLRTGGGCIAIGAGSFFSSVSVKNEIIIGASDHGGDDDCVGQGEDTVTIGKSGAVIYSTAFTAGTVAWAQTSDSRRKQNIQDDTIGLAFINKLKNRTFQWKPYSEHPDEWEDWGLDDDGNKVYSELDTDRVQHGFIAQEIKQALDECSITTFDIWNEDKNGKQGLASGLLVLPLTKAVQELSAKIDTMQTEINNLKAE